MMVNTTTTFTISVSLEDQKNAILERLVKDGHITMAEAFILKKEEPQVQNWGFPIISYPSDGLPPWSVPYTYTSSNRGDGAMNATCSHINTN
jgi:hypothetical protein